ncbi:MAG: TolC family protein [Verrucomicrobia bacterium]|nr:TolC family protein [Verrucomicrobiota bacterium]
MKILFCPLLVGSLLVSGFFAAPACAAAEPELLSLAALVEDTLAKNPELKFYEAEIAAAKGERRGAGALPNPELTVGGGYKGVRSSAGQLLGEGAAWSVSLAQPIEWPGRLSLRKAIADKQVALAELGLAQFRYTLRQRTGALGYAVLAAQQKAAAANEIATRFNTLRDVLVQRDPAGVTPQLEIGILEGTALTQQRRASDAAIEELKALAALNQLRGVPAHTPLKVAGELPPFPAARPLAELLDAARTNNFDLRARAAELEKQGFKVDLARNERKPAITVAPYFSREHAGDRDTQAGLSLTIPLGFNSAAKGRAEAERARLTQAEASLGTAQREVERKVVEAALQYEVKRAELARWDGDPAVKFRANAELADRHYRLGAVPIATYLEAQKTFLEVLETLTDTRREAWEAWLELATLTGLNSKD